MAYNTKGVKTDVNGKPVPQTFDTTVDDYVPEDRADAKATNATGNWSMIALLKGIFSSLLGTLTATLAAGSNLIGKVGLDQTTDGTTNRVVSKISQTAGENKVAIGDGDAASIGAKADAAATDSTSSWSLIALFKAVLAKLLGTLSVNVTGSNLMPTVTTLTTTPLAAGASGSSAVIDLSAAPGYGLVEVLVAADTVTQVDVAFDDGTKGLSTTNSHVRAAFQPAAAPQQMIPAFRPFGKRMQIFWSNPTATPQTTLRIYLLNYPYPSVAPHNLRALLFYNLAIRDTNQHNYSSDAGFGFIFTRIALGGGKVPIYINNTHDQQVAVSVQLAVRGTLDMALGSVNVPASSKKLITNADFAGIDVPFESMFLIATAAVAPTTGVLSAWVDSLVGSGA